MVLTGGASRRMGSDKALLELDGVPLARRVADALTAAGARQVLAVGGDVDALRAHGLDVVPDEHPGEGPLGGILTALAATDEEVVVVLACDLPAVDPAAITAVVDALGDADAAAPWHDGRHELLHAAWHRRAENHLRAAYEAGERAPRRAVTGLTVASVTGLTPAALADADDPADLPQTGPMPDRPHRPGYPAPMDVPEIDVAELARQREAGAAILDVRNPDEYAVTHVPGVVLIPLGELVERVAEVPSEGTLPVICRSGNRSRQAAEWLRGQGIDAVNVAGGMLAWTEAGLLVESGGATT